MLMVKAGGRVSILKFLTYAYVRMWVWVRSFELLTDVYVGGLVGWDGRIPCLRKMWMTPERWQRNSRTLIKITTKLIMLFSFNFVIKWEI